MSHNPLEMTKDLVLAQTQAHKPVEHSVHRVMFKTE